MEFLTTRCRLDWLCWRNSSTELSRFISKIMRLRRPWKCINKCISGKRLSKWPRSRIMERLRNWRVTITRGCLSPDRRKRLQRLRRKKGITLLQYNCIWRVVFPHVLLMSFTTPMWATHKTCLRKSLATLLLQECSKRLVNSMNKWRSFKKPSTVTSRAMSTRKQSTSPRMLNPDWSPAYNNVGATTSSPSSKPKQPSTTSLRQKRSKKPLRHQLLPGTGTRLSNFWPIRLQKLLDRITDKLQSTMRPLGSMTLLKSITWRRRFQLMHLRCMLKLESGNRLWEWLKKTFLKAKLLIYMSSRPKSLNKKKSSKKLRRCTLLLKSTI